MAAAVQRSPQTGIHGQIQRVPSRRYKWQSQSATRRGLGQHSFRAYLRPSRRDTPLNSLPIKPPPWERPMRRRLQSTQVQAAGWLPRT